MCGAVPLNEAHHLSLWGTGWGTKPSDLMVIPLCNNCHGCVHAFPKYFDKVRDKLVNIIIAYIGEYIQLKMALSSAAFNAVMEYKS